MTHSKMLATPTEFNPFLYAGIGDDKNGMELTLLSALARQNVDPWQKAADWSQLPEVAAMQTLDSWLKSVPGHESPRERFALAERLLCLLPHPATMQSLEPDPLRAAQPPARAAHTPELTLVLIYCIAMVVTGWWFSENAPTQIAAHSAAASAPVAAESAPSKSVVH